MKLLEFFNFIHFELSVVGRREDKERDTSSDTDKGTMEIEN